MCALHYVYGVQGQTQRSVPTPTDFREGNPIRAFERFIAEAMEELDGKALLLLLDVFWWFHPWQFWPR